MDEQCRIVDVVVYRKSQAKRTSTETEKRKGKGKKNKEQSKLS
jgi:hypothetical protein